MASLIFVFLLAMSFLCHCLRTHQSPIEYFISLDCGSPANTTYTESNSTFPYISDAAYINNGVTKNLSSTFKDHMPQHYHLVRSFPQGRRNCYNIDHVQKYTKYLMRATFLYGNYDGLNQPPKFDLYFGDSLWNTVNLIHNNTLQNIESIHFTTQNQVQICLINTGNGIPFISSLEFRPLPNNTYNTLTKKSLLLFKRSDMGSTEKKTLRYPDDKYDRIWEPDNRHEWQSISTNGTTNSYKNNSYDPGFAIMRTASIPINTTAKMEITWKSSHENAEYYVYLHFAELQNLQPNQTRGFNITYNGNLWYGPCNISEFLKAKTVDVISPTPIPSKRHQISLIPIENSTLPPIINALEVYSVIDLLELTSDQQDVDAIKSIKSRYGIVKDWEGDPCVPRAYPWEGIDCTKTNGTAPKIVSLNLSWSALAGEIFSGLKNLTMLETLDLSNNNLTGNIPDFLSSLSNLKVLNLNNNKLTGSIPSELIHRFPSSSFEGNPNLEYCTSDSCNNKKKSVVIPIVASIGGFIVVVVISITILCMVKLKKKQQNETAALKMDPNQVMSDHFLGIKRRQFTYSEVLKMTNNFERTLGKGGFGMVYYGAIDGIQVAVKKLSQVTGQGYQQFQAEVTHLLRVHHKNLTNLVGYLNEGDNIGLIYEFMANGNLAEYLSAHVLNWQDRLRIAVDAAQGLEYLHDGCTPPIIHRDVKTTNILLTEDLKGKLGDFGLSKIFSIDDDNNNKNSKSTMVADTPGYFDPEYDNSNQLTKWSDVYSFGVTLMEIMSGRDVISRKEENVHISKWVSSLVGEGDIHAIIDSRLDRNYDTDSAWKAVEIAMDCVSENPATRPAMIGVVAELKNCLAMELYWNGR